MGGRLAQCRERAVVSMQAWEVTEPRPIDQRPLRPVRRQVPEPARREVLVRVSACGVCRTDLHVAEGDLPVHRPGVVPGHEVVGEVVGTGDEVPSLSVGDRVGIAWLRHTCGACRWCLSGRENLCPQSLYTGWDADGGYAEYVVADAGYVYQLPAELGEATAIAPLLCAGVIGYRALLRAELPRGGRLGIYGFGASAHITAQIAQSFGAEVHVLTRGDEGRSLATELGVASVAGPYDSPPVPLDSAIVFAPAGELVPLALEALDPGGCLALAGIHMSDVPVLDYQRHLFHEKTLRSVTSNTRADGVELLRLAARLRPTVTTTTYVFDRADVALEHLAAGTVRGAAVLTLPG